MKILIFSKNWIGDVVFELPAIDAIAHAYPGAQITCLAPVRCHGILKMHSAIHDVLSFDEKKEQRSIFSKLRFILKLKKLGPWDIGFLLHKSKTRAWIFKKAGVKKRIGYSMGREAYLTDFVREPEGEGHHVDFHLNLLNKIGLETESFKNYQITPPEKAVLEIKNRLTALAIDDFYCFHLGANWEPKRWPIQHWAKLADLIWEEYQLPILLTGGEGDRPLAEEMLNYRDRAQVISWVGETTLEELAALFQKAKGLVTADSGPMHIASAVGCSVLALFGPTDPALTGPRGIGATHVLSYVPEGFKVPFYGKQFPEGGWMENISPETVFSNLKENFKR